MGRYAPGAYTAYKNTPWVQDGDIGFQGTDMLHERSFLQPRMLARCENKRLWDGPAATRPGTTFPADFNPVFEGKIIGSYIYSNVNAEEVMLIATAKDGVTTGCSYVWQLQFGKDPVKINLSGGHTTGNAAVEFCQAFDKILLIRRPSLGQAMLIWDGFPAGAGPPVHSGTFDDMVLSTDGLKLARQTWYAEPFENRVIYYFAYGLLNWRTQFNMSDILDPTSYDDIFGVFRVSASGSDQITRLLGYQKGTLMIFMRHSVHTIENFTVDPNQAVQRVLSTKVGGVGNKVPLLVGAEVFFLDEPGGFYKASQIIQDQTATDPIPISMLIRPIIDQIDWGRKDSLGLDFVACSEVLGPYCFFAVPLLGKSGANDAVLVYNTVTSNWESVPDWWDDADFRIDRLHVTQYNQTRRLFGLDYAARKIYLLYDGIVDNVNGNVRTIKDTIETRGYVCNDPGGFKRFERVLIGITTVAPQMTITAISDGVGEEQTIVTGLTKSNTRSYVHGRGPISVDPTAPKLEDYSGGGVGDFVIQDFESLSVGDIATLPAVAETGHTGDEAQQSLERFPVRQIGRWCSIRIENKNGNCNIGGVAIEGIPIEETVKVIA